MKTYKQVWDGEWNPLERHAFIACCDCGLVHQVEIRVRRGQPQVAYTRMERRTAQVRRQMKARKEGVFCGS